MEKLGNMEIGNFSEEIKRDKKEMSEDNHKNLIYWEVLRPKQGQMVEKKTFSPPFFCFKNSSLRGRL